MTATECQRTHLERLAKANGFGAVSTVLNEWYGNPCEYLTKAKASLLIAELEDGWTYRKAEQAEQAEIFGECDHCGADMIAADECEQGCVQ